MGGARGAHRSGREAVPLFRLGECRLWLCQAQPGDGLGLNPAKGWPSHPGWRVERGSHGDRDQEKEGGLTTQTADLQPRPEAPWGVTEGFL